MKRKTFIKNVVVATAGIPLINIIDSKKSFQSIFKKGDKIGLITPASATSSEGLELAKENIRSLGLEPVFGKHVGQKQGYLGGSDSERLGDIEGLLKNEKIKGIWCIRGGYGTPRLLKNLPYHLIKKRSLPLIGYSDITALHLAFLKKVNLLSYHGPLAAYEWTTYAKSKLEEMFLSDEKNIEIKPTGIEEKGLIYDEYVINPGVGTGKLVGGNLSLVAALCGTDYQVCFKNKIVFLEDVGENPYRVDRMLHQLIQAGDLAKANGIILGQFVDCDGNGNPNLKTLLKDILAPLMVPTAYGLPIGHVDNQCTIPVGGSASFGATENKLVIHR